MLLIALSTLVTYLNAILIEACNVVGKIKIKKICVIITLICNVEILCVFKYTILRKCKCDSI